MSPIKCPDCGTDQFYVKDPEDQYTISEFSLASGEVAYLEADDEEEQIPVLSDSEIYCERCSWHDKFSTLQGKAP